MMDKDRFKRSISKLVALYPTWSIKVEDSYVMSMWYEQFGNIKTEAFEAAVEEHIKTVRFNPCVASIYELIKDKRVDIIDVPVIIVQNRRTGKEPNNE